MEEITDPFIELERARQLERKEVRITVTTEFQERQLRGRIILSEITKNEFHIFSPEPLRIGLELVISISDPDISLRGKVIMMTLLESHLLKEDPFQYRIWVERQSEDEP